MRRTLMALAASAMLAGPMVATPADVSAARDQAGLVVVNIEGNKDLVNVLNENQVAVAASAIVQACDLADLNVEAVTVTLLAIDTQQINNFTFCRTDGGKVSARNT